MHRRKLAIALAAALSSGILMAQAPDQNQAPANAPAQAPTQPQATRAHHMANPNRQARRLAKKLDLNKDQVAQIKPILADRQRQMQALHADTSLSQQDRREKMRGIMEDSKNKIEAVLNDQQKQQFEQMLAQRRAHRHEAQAQPQGQ